MDDLLTRTLTPYGAELHKTPGGNMIRVAGHEYGPIPDPVDPVALSGQRLEDATVPGRAVVQSAAAFVEFKSIERGVLADHRYSEAGKAEQLAKPTEKLLQNLLASHLTIDANGKDIDKIEAQRYALPAPPDNPVAEMRQREIRDWMRSLPQTEQLKLMHDLKGGQDTPLLRSILHSPIQFAELEKYAVEAWRTRIDLDDPVGLEWLKIGRASLDWAKRCVLIAQANVVPGLRLHADRVIDAVGQKSAQEFFNVSAHDVAMYQRRAVAAARR